MLPLHIIYMIIMKYEEILLDYIDVSNEHIFEFSLQHQVMVHSMVLVLSPSTMSNSSYISCNYTLLC